MVVVVMMMHLCEHIGLRRLARAHRMHHIWRLLCMKVVLIHIEVRHGSSEEHLTSTGHSFSQGVLFAHPFALVISVSIGLL